MDLPQAVADVLRKAECQDLFTKEGTRIMCTLNGHCVPFDSIGVLERFIGCACRVFVLLGCMNMRAELRSVAKQCTLIPNCRSALTMCCKITCRNIDVQGEEV